MRMVIHASVTSAESEFCFTSISANHSRNDSSFILRPSKGTSIRRSVLAALHSVYLISCEYCALNES